MKTFFSIILFLIPTLLLSQDLIINTDGKKIHCEIIEEDSAKIYLLLNHNNTLINSFIPKERVKAVFYGYDNRKWELRDTLASHQLDSKCITIGFLQGGGALIGFDAEVLLTRFVGIQAGAGFVGFGAGVNFHFKPDVRSSFISIQYWHQGIEKYFTQSLIGPNLVFRAKRIFTAQIGLGFVLETGPAWSSSTTQSPVILTYSLGIFFPG